MNNNNSIRKTHLIPQDQYKQVNCWSSKLLQPMLFQSEEALAGLPFIATTCHVDCNYCVVATWIVVVYFDHLLLPSWNATVDFDHLFLPSWTTTVECDHLLPPRFVSPAATSWLFLLLPRWVGSPSSYPVDFFCYKLPPPWAVVALLLPLWLLLL